MAEGNFKITEEEFNARYAGMLFVWETYFEETEDEDE